MSFKSSPPSRPNVILRVDNSRRVTTRTIAPNESSNHTALASEKILAQKEAIMKAWTQASKDRNVEETENLDEDIEIEYKKLELNRDRAKTKAFHTKDV